MTSWQVFMNQPESFRKSNNAAAGTNQSDFTSAGIPLRNHQHLDQQPRPKEHKCPIRLDITYFEYLLWRQCIKCILWAWYMFGKPKQNDLIILQWSGHYFWMDFGCFFHDFPTNLGWFWVILAPFLEFRIHFWLIFAIVLNASTFLLAPFWVHFPAFSIQQNIIWLIFRGLL